MLKQYKNILSIRAEIIKVEERNMTHFSLIYQYLSIKYALTEVSAKGLLNAQRKLLYDEINQKNFFEKSYKTRSNQLVSLKYSFTWMKYENIDLLTEAIYSYIQDRNVFWRDDALRCQHKSKKSINHLVTGCNRIFDHDCTRRHNEVLRCTYHLLTNK
ncbi:hypothetical protein TCON_0752 [Astathelohania contejeani]|uniref:Uncharacterized protein n=1 Tax=Astathelohania contejeani TaxID=164912 RepID=A0ABQ7I0P8_9MICR|nr:hypothetical protein TCON_0752 [Thelohania contejeani]